MTNNLKNIRKLLLKQTCLVLITSVHSLYSLGKCFPAKKTTHIVVEHNKYLVLFDRCTHNREADNLKVCFDDLLIHVKATVESKYYELW